MRPGHADVVNHRHAHAHPVERFAGLFGDRQVAGAGRDHRDPGRRAMIWQDSVSRRETCGPTELCRPSGNFAVERCRLFRADARDQGVFAMLDELSDDLAEFGRSFCRGHRRLRESRSASSIEIEGGGREFRGGRRSRRLQKLANDCREFVGREGAR